MSPSLIPEYQKLCPWSIMGGQVCKGVCPYDHDQALLKAAWDENGLVPTATTASNQAAAITSNTAIATDDVVVTTELPKYAFLCREFTAGNGCKNNRDEQCEMIHDSNLRKAVLNVEAIAKKAGEEADSCNGYKSHRACHFYTIGAKCFSGKNCHFIHDSSLREAAYEVIAKYQYVGLSLS
jgi:hypothetical protein